MFILRTRSKVLVTWMKKRKINCDSKGRIECCREIKYLKAKGSERLFIYSFGKNENS